MAAEYSNARRHNLNVALNISGYSMGAILGGMVVSALLGGPDSWRLVFLFGGAMTAIALPCAYLLLPESIDSLLARRPANALAQINQTLVRLGHAPVKSLPPQPDRMEKPSIASLFSRDFAGITILLAIAYFAQIMLFYYIQKWVPKIVADMGFTASQAARVLVCANIGNLLGAVLVGVAAQRLSVRPLIIASMLLGTIAISLFGLGFHDLVRLSVAVAVSAFFINAGVVGLYPIMAATFPASLRATGTGFVIGVGRGGSAIGPIVVGALLARGRRLFRVSVSMGIGGVVAAAMLLLLPLGLARRSDASAR